MLALHQSNRLEILADRLADVLERPLSSVFAAEEVVVPHPGMGKWLSLHLARKQGVCANVRFSMPAGYVWEMFGFLFEEVPATSGFDPAILRWRLAALLDKPPSEGRHEPLGRYLKEADERMRLELCQRLADCLDQYLVFRPDWILAWESGRQAVTGDDWQASLWRELVKGNAGHWVHWRQRFVDLVDSGRLDRSRLPERICLFAVQTLSPGYLDVVTQLAESVEVHMFLLNPCEAFWADIVSEAEVARREASGDVHKADYLEVGHPLLASLGGQGRDFFSLVMESDPGSDEAFESAGRRCLLHRLQDDVLQLQAPEAQAESLAVDDRSLQVHVCHSAAREVEVLKDGLLQLFERDPHLQPSDVVVMAPDVAAYGPLIDAVFGAERAGPRIPYHLADGSPADTAPLIHALMGLLRMSRERYANDAVLAVLESPAVQRRFGLSETSYPTLVRWVRETGIRWGWDAQDRASHGLPGEMRNTWRRGLDNLLLGYAMGGADGTTLGDRLPYREISSEGARLLGGLLEFATRLRSQLADAQQARPIAAWVAWITVFLDAFFAPTLEEEPQLQDVREAVARLGEQARLGEYTGAIELDTLLWLLEGQLRGAGGGVGFLRGGVTFCALTPLRSLPFRVVCLLGMNDGAFPRERHTADFDLMKDHPRIGDRSRRADDRYLFLETLISTRQCLWLSYVGRDVRDNAELPPSVLVSELLDCLERMAPVGEGEQVRKTLVTEHPLQPFSECYFDQSSALFSYSANWLEAARHLLGREGETQTFICARLPEAGVEWQQVSLQQLESFFTHPVRFLLTGRLGMRLTAGEEMPDSRDPFGVERFAWSGWLDEAVVRLIAREGTDEVRACMRAAGVLPHGEYGDYQFARLEQEALAFARVLNPFADLGGTNSLSVDLSFGSRRLVGQLDRIGPHGQFGYNVHKLGAKGLLKLWLRHLCLNACSGPNTPGESRWVDCEGLHLLRPVGDARAQLSALMDLYWEGLHRPLPFMPRSAWVYVEKLGAEKPREEAFKSASSAWDGSDYGVGEGQDSYYRQVYADATPLDEEFEALALKVFEPLLAHYERPD